MPVARNGLQNNDPIEILTQYNGEIRGIYNYCRMARNASVFNQFYYVIEYSMYKTLAVKMRCSAARIKRKYTKNRIFGIEYETKHGLKRAEFYHDGFRKSVPALFTGCAGDDPQCHPRGAGENILEYANLLEKAEPDPVRGLQAPYQSLPRPGGGGDVPGLVDRLRNQQGDNSAAISVLVISQITH